MPHTDPGASLAEFFRADLRHAIPITAVRIVHDGRSFAICIDAAHAYTPEAARNIAGHIAELLTQALSHDGVTCIDGRPFTVPVLRP